MQLHNQDAGFVRNGWFMTFKILLHNTLEDNDTQGKKE